MTSNQEESAAGEARGRMLRALREAIARGGGVRRVSGLSLLAVLCASAVAPVTLVGQTVGPLIATWLATAGSIGSNVVADVILSVASRRAAEQDGDAGALERAVAAELEVRMAAPGVQAAELRGAVASLLAERGAPQVLVQALADGDSGGAAVVLAESMALMAAQFEEFTGLLVTVRAGLQDLRHAEAERRAEQKAENRAQAEHRGSVRVALDRILLLLQEGSARAGGAGVVYNALPPDTAAFTGRRDEIDEITARVTAAATRGGVIGISAIDGMPGVGKSALAVHVAHLLAEQFPDRQLFVDLHAHADGRPPADPAATLAGLLTGDGLDPRRLPADLEDLAALWRTRMAGRRALIVLDNAADSAQVAPLLPGGDGCLVLVTSRRHLGDLPYAVTEVSLDVMPPDDAVAMFLRLSSRAAGDPEQVAELVALSGYLPLAISLLARVYTKHRAWSMGDLIEETRARLLTLSAEHHTVAAAFDLSYQALAPARRRFFRLLGLHPGSDLDAYAAAALTGTSLGQARAHLSALHGDHLVTEPGYRRYGMHDLIRAHARIHTEGEDPIEQREAALDRLSRYYAHTAQTASLPIARLPRSEPAGPAPAHAPDLTSPQDAWSWLRAEYSNLQATHAYASADALDEHSVALAAGLAEILQVKGPLARALEIHRAAADTAARRRRPIAHATALTDLGRVRYQAGDYPGADDTLTRALRISHRNGDALGEANTLINLGRLRYQYSGDMLEAADIFARALEIYRRLDNSLGEANALTNLGYVQHLTGLSPGDEAITRALEIFRRIGNRRGEANALNDLGYMRYLTGDFPRATDAHTQALRIFRDIEHRTGEANSLTDLGHVGYKTGEHPQAAEALTQALTIYRQIGDRRGEATALNYLGRVRCLTGDLKGAEDTLTRALQIYEQIGSLLGVAGAQTALGRVRLLAGDLPGAASVTVQGLQIYHRIGDRVDEAWALTHYAAITAAAGEHLRALGLYQRAQSMNRELNNPSDEALDLEGIAEYYFATADQARGTEHLRQALQIYQRLSMRFEVERVVTRLAAFAQPPAASQVENG